MTQEEIFSRLETIETLCKELTTECKEFKKVLGINFMPSQYENKLTLSELLDFDDNIKLYPCTAIMRACVISGKVEEFDNSAIEAEFNKRNWTVLRWKEMIPKPTVKEYNKFIDVLKVTIMCAYDNKQHSRNTTLKTGKELIINGYDLFQ